MKRMLITLMTVAMVAFASAAGSAEVIPLVQMENVRLTDAIRQLARKAQLNIVIDPRLTRAPYDRITISIRWEKVTAREALIALLDNHGLMLVE